MTELRISSRIADKIMDRGIHPEEVRATVEDVRRLPFSWVNDEERGDRAYVAAEIQDRPAAIVLYPAEGELGTVWNLGSAYFLDE